MKTLCSGFLVSILLRVWALSINWKIEEITVTLEGEVNPRKTGCIFAFWHDQQIFMPWLYRRYHRTLRTKLHMLISYHRDGRIAAETIRFLGIRSIAGSSSRGGTEALFQMKNLLQTGAHICITPDGPRGPRHQAKGGAIKLASITQSPIFPLALAANKVWTSNAWDSMFIPKPFSTVAITMGPPLIIPPNLTKSEERQFQLKLDEALTDITARAQRIASAQGS